MPPAASDSQDAAKTDQELKSDSEEAKETTGVAKRSKEAASSSKSKELHTAKSIEANSSKK